MSRPTLSFDSPGNRLPLLRLLWLIPAIVLLITFLSTWFTVPADSLAVVLRFGKFHGNCEPGLHWKLPLGIDEVSIVPVKRQLKLEFGLATNDYSAREFTNPDQIGEDAERERSMVTGDLNSVLVEWVVQYHIHDPRQYLFHVREPGQTLRDLSEAVMREVVGDRTVDEVITSGRQDIETTANERLRKMVEIYQLGVQIDQLQLKNVNPPQPVQASFNEVNKAQQDKESMINVANGEYNKVVPRARGEAEQKVSESEGYKKKRVNEALGDVAAFRAMLEQYLKAPAVTRTRLYLETMKEVLPGIGDTWIIDGSVTQVLPLVQGAGGEVRK